VALRTAALLGAGGDTEDVVQEAFVKAYASLERFRPGAPFRPWLLKIVANETRNLHRASGRRSAREQRSWAQTERLLLARPDDPAEAALSQERQEALVRGLAQLSPPHRQVVMCRYLLDLDEAESAAVLGWPRGTVKSRLHRALDRLAGVLAEPAPSADEITSEVRRGA
jgi:RNA polymerase sigma-70 factor (ECF subfamily)